MPTYVEPPQGTFFFVTARFTDAAQSFGNSLEWSRANGKPLGVGVGPTWTGTRYLGFTVVGWRSDSLGPGLVRISATVTYNVNGLMSGVFCTWDLYDWGGQTQVVLHQYLVTYPR